MHKDYGLNKSYDTRTTITTNKSNSLVLWEYKFKITLQDWKRMIQCTFPPYDMDTLWGITAVINDMDNIFSYATDMYHDAKRMLKEKTNSSL